MAEELEEWSGMAMIQRYEQTYAAKTPASGWTSNADRPFWYTSQVATALSEPRMSKSFTCPSKLDNDENPRTIYKNIRLTSRT